MRDRYQRSQEIGIREKRKGGVMKRKPFILLPRSTLLYEYEGPALIQRHGPGGGGGKGNGVGMSG